MADGETNVQLEACKETVQRLEEENGQLRQAAGTFGQLAERLNQTLRDERRLGDERRTMTRPSSDRRSSTC